MCYLHHQEPNMKNMYDRTPAIITKKPNFLVEQVIAWIMVCISSEITKMWVVLITYLAGKVNGSHMVRSTVYVNSNSPVSLNIQWVPKSVYVNSNPCFA